MLICSRWFKKYSGLANGIISAGAGLFVTFLSPVIAQIILNDGIGKAYFFSGACLLVTVGLVNLLFLRNTPEEIWDSIRTVPRHLRKQRRATLLF